MFARLLHTPSLVFRQVAGGEDSHVAKANPYHDELGRFSSADSGGKPLKVYRGHGEGSSTSGVLTWVTPDKDLATRYAGERAGGVVDEYEINPEKAFDVGKDSMAITPSMFAVKVLTQARDEGRVTNQEAAALRREFMEGQSSGDAKVHQLWAEEDGKKKVADLLRKAGFDSIKLEENGVVTYGVLGAAVLKANPYHDELGRFATADGARFVSTGPAFAKFLGRQRAGGAGAGSSEGKTQRHKPMKFSELAAFFQEEGLLDQDGNLARGKSRFMDDNQPTFLRALSKKLGYMEKPRMVHSEDLDAAIADGAVELWRGKGKPGHNVNFRSAEPDDFYVGNGVFGNGLYAAIASPNWVGGDLKNALDTARSYTNGGRGLGSLQPFNQPEETAKIMRKHPQVLKFALEKDAKVITTGKLFDELTKVNTQVGAMTGDAARPIKNALHILATDESLLAAALGYDAIHVTGSGYMVVLNRGKAIVEDQGTIGTPKPKPKSKSK